MITLNWASDALFFIDLRGAYSVATQTINPTNHLNRGGEFTQELLLLPQPFFTARVHSNQRRANFIAVGVDVWFHPNWQWDPLHNLRIRLALKYMSIFFNYSMKLKSSLAFSLSTRTVLPSGLFDADSDSNLWNRCQMFKSSKNGL